MRPIPRSIPVEPQPKPLVHVPTPPGRVYPLRPTGGHLRGTLANGDRHDRSTSGATVEECARTLYQNGARSVNVFTLARVAGLSERMTTPLSLGVLISGGGTNLQALIDAIERRDLPAQIRIVVSNRNDAYGLVRARRHGLSTAVLSHTGFASREEFDHHLVTLLRDYEVELVVLAGFMRLLSARFIQAFPQRILNIHPALLPAFPGLHAQRQALKRGVRISGATVHLVDEEMDHGPIIMQAAVPVYPDDTEDSLSARILVQEHRIYPAAIKLFAEGRVRVQDNRVLLRDEHHRPETAFRSPAV